MSSRRSFFSIFISAVVLVLLFGICFSFISASPAVAKETAQEEDRIAELTRQVDALTRVVEELSDPNQYYLVLRTDITILRGTVTVYSAYDTIPVDRWFYDSCQEGDDISDRLRHLCSNIAGTSSVYVDTKYFIPTQ